MRDIKFRGQSYFRNDWWYGYYVFSERENKHFIVKDAIENRHGFVNFSHFAEIDPLTLGEFTGLKDKNGNDIFEGDIVLTQNETKRVIVYEKAAFHVNGENEGKKVSHPLYYQCVMQKGSKIDFEIIGNIHDNAELLK